MTEIRRSEAAEGERVAEGGGRVGQNATTSVVAVVITIVKRRTCIKRRKRGAELNKSKVTEIKSIKFDDDKESNYDDQSESREHSKTLIYISN
jgi:hypothetical protein